MSALLNRRRVAALQSGLAETILSHHEAHGAWSSADFRRFFNQEIRNRGKGISEIEGKAARVAASESGDERVSNEENSCVPALTHVLPPIRPVGFPIYVARRPAAPFTRLNCPCPICADPWLAFLRAKKAAGIIFVSPLSSTADHGGELGGDLESAKHSVYAGRVEQWPQPAPPGCGLSTSSTSLQPR